MRRTSSANAVSDALRDLRPDTARPTVVVDGPEADTLVEHSLDLVQGRLALLPVGLAGLLPVERVATVMDLRLIVTIFTTVFVAEHHLVLDL